MIHIITGDTNSGKSARFVQLFNAAGNGVGLFSKKLYADDNSIKGYHLMLLPDGIEHPFIILKADVPPEEAEMYLFQGRFAFLKNSFSIGENYLLTHLPRQSVWIDEIGSVELKGFGFDTLLRKLIDTEMDVTFTVKRSLLERVIAKYGITDFAITETSRTNHPL